MMPLMLRIIGVNDYSVPEGGQRIGRMSFADGCSPGVWLRHVVVHIQGPTYVSAKSLDEAKRSFKAAWLARGGARGRPIAP
ncbi:hypothetical protein JQ625_28280 [Bradyrhizobium diazoefficiens]|nr:hypothetical protein [Bradyrhizobium diazoefficiens]MBR0778743.1 hypothetical protein [Bradyrhizobium diazoefficiens]